MVDSFRDKAAPQGQIKISVGPYELILRRNDGHPLGFPRAQHADTIRAMEKLMHQELELTTGAAKPQRPLRRSDLTTGDTKLIDGATAKVALRWPQRNSLDEPTL